MYADTVKESRGHTNRNGEQKYGSKWRHIEMDNMLQFHGCLLHMAVVNRNKMKDYWNEYANHTTRQLGMSRDRFMMIYGALRLYDENEARRTCKSVPAAKEKYDPLFKCRPVWNTTMLNFQKARNPGRVLSLDESMAKYMVH